MKMLVPTHFRVPVIVSRTVMSAFTDDLTQVLLLVAGELHGLGFVGEIIQLLPGLRVQVGIRTWNIKYRYLLKTGVIVLV